MRRASTDSRSHDESQSQIIDEGSISRHESMTIHDGEKKLSTQEKVQRWAKDVVRDVEVRSNAIGPFVNTLKQLGNNVIAASSVFHNALATERIIGTVLNTIKKHPIETAPDVHDEGCRVLCLLCHHQLENQLAMFSGKHGSGIAFFLNCITRPRHIPAIDTVEVIFWCLSFALVDDVTILPPEIVDSLKLQFMDGHGVEICQQMMARFPTAFNLHSYCLSIFADLMNIEEFTPILMSLNILETAMTSVSQFPTDVTVILPGSIIFNTISLIAESRPLLVSSGCIAIITEIVLVLRDEMISVSNTDDAITSSKHDPASTTQKLIEIHEHSLCCLQKVASASSSIRAELYRLGCVPAVLDIMKLHKRSSLIQRHGCIFIANISVGNDRVKDYMIEHSVIEIIRDALTHRRDAFVAMAAAMALGDICGSRLAVNDVIQYKIFYLLSDILLEHDREFELTEQVAYALSGFSVVDVCRVEIGRSGIIRSLIRSLFKIGNHLPAYDQGLLALGNIMANNSINKQQVSNSRGLPWVIDTMYRFLPEALIQVRSIRALLNLLTGMADLCSQFCSSKHIATTNTYAESPQSPSSPSESLHPSILSAQPSGMTVLFCSLRCHKQNKSIITLGLQLMAEVCSNNSENKVKMVGDCAIELILDILDHNRDSKRVVKYALLTLGLLATDERVAVEIALSGCIIKLVEILNQNIDSKAILRIGAIAMGNLGADNLMNKRQLYDDGVIGVLCQACKTYPQCASVVKYCIQAIGNVCHDMSLLPLLFQDGVIDVIMAAMQTHYNHMNIQRTCCRALSLLMVNDDCCQRIVRLHGIDLIIKAIKEFSSCAILVEDGLLALAIMSSPLLESYLPSPPPPSSTPSSALDKIITSSSSSLLSSNIASVPSPNPRQEYHSLIIQKDAIDMTLNTLRAHSGTESILDFGCALLYQLSVAHPVVRRMLIDKHAIELFVRCINLYPINEFLIINIINTFVLIRPMFGVDSIMLHHGVVDVLETVIVLHTNNTELRRLARHFIGTLKDVSPDRSPQQDKARGRDADVDTLDLLSTEKKKKGKKKSHKESYKINQDEEG